MLRLIDYMGIRLVVLGMDFTDINAYCRCWPLSGPNPIYCRTRAGDVDGSLGTVEALEKIVPFYRQAFPNKLPIFRADGGFNRPEADLCVPRDGT